MDIKAVLFDLGGTLEDLSSTQEEQKACIARVQKLLKRASKGFWIPQEEFYDKLMNGYREYKAWTQATGKEKSPEEIWADDYLKDFPKENRLVKAMADRLAELWETEFYTRDVKEGVAAVLERLRQMGCQLGLISNTTSRTVPFMLLERYGIDSYFDCVLLSSVEGVRKPRPEMFAKACSLLGAEPKQCMYVGDQAAKDIAGAAAAGYGAKVLITSDFTASANGPVPDYRITGLGELISILEK